MAYTDIPGFLATAMTATTTAAPATPQLWVTTFNTEYADAGADEEAIVIRAKVPPGSTSFNDIYFEMAIPA